VLTVIPRVTTDRRERPAANSMDTVEDVIIKIPAAGWTATFAVSEIS
jgi:hypothetical protein